ncbi:MAG: HAMP domain-containing histidine kinase [Gammaproteobacteria bacterium]|nr:HAMP domain-containing histidine kinase [Gammaproteobacteria bacterium]
MRRFRPTALMPIISMGFVVVALPLIGAIATAIVRVDAFATEGRVALVSVQQTASSSRALADRITELERTARQYHALADDSYRDLYEEHRADVRVMFDRLLENNEYSDLQPLLERALHSERRAHQVVLEVGSGTATSTALELAFANLRDAVMRVVQAHNGFVRDLGNSLPEQADGLQRLLMSQASWVIPLSVGLALLFGSLIARPLSQIDKGIRSLGRGSLSDSIRVSGSSDLEEMGLRLDALRIRLLELEAQKAQFLRNVSHELKTPLTNIREGAELLVIDGVDSEQNTIARILQDNSVRLQKMIEQLLRYGADGDLDPEQPTETIQFHRLVQDVADKHYPILSARQVVLTSDLSAVLFDGNAKRLRVIVDNLLSNAAKHTPAGGTINIGLNGNDTGIVLDVVDSGDGVDSEDAPYLFDWFYTGSRSGDTVVAGAGMGLAIAQEYAKQHAGVIESLPCKDGAHFRLTISGKHYAQA